MAGLDLSDAALEALSYSDLNRTATDIGMSLPQHGEEREQTIKRIWARRDHPVRKTDISGRGFEQVRCKISERFAAKAEII